MGYAKPGSGPIKVSYSLNLNMLSNYLYKGNDIFNEDFRVLLAGGGTGTATCFMGEQLRDKNAEVVYLDFSRASQAIAEQRANIRGLNNVRFVLGSIESLPDLELGNFSFVASTGVLHHLPDPLLGLRSISNSLHPEGGGSIMLYARYGRTGIYQMQALAKVLNEDVLDRDIELDNIYLLLRSMSKGELNKEMLIRRLDANLDMEKSFYNKILEDQLENSAYKEAIDGEAYDRLCNKLDQPFSVSEIYEFVEAADLHLVSFNNPKELLKYDLNL